ncbi:MAG: hypothetical protein M3024_07460, partial [Candidatus Dormibacteraeota bacterium]|nr:hypothetical protein [Candidatus Dormibacteraeota bacterium]
GDPVTFTYLVTNTGNVTLNPVTLTDNVLGTITCPQASLAIGASETCTAAGGAATAGAHQNTATVTGQGVDNTGTPVGPPVTAADTANYFGSAPAITLVKNVNGQHEPTAPGLFVPIGNPVTFTYLVTNTGNVTLNPVALTDSVLGAITCPQASLAPAVSETCTASGGAATAGAHQNTAVVTGQGVDNAGSPIGVPVTGADTANYFGALSALTLVKNLNGLHEPNPPGLDVLVGDPITFTYVVTNTGNVTLDPVALVDDVLGTITCPQASLAAGQSETCTVANVAAVVGPNPNTATVTGQGVDDTGAPVGPPATATDTGNYFGSLHVPAITLVKLVNGQHEPSAPGLYIPAGSPVNFSFLVTNDGDALLNPVTVSDNVLGPIICPQASLAPGESETCVAAGGNATAGAHANTATATGEALDASGNHIGTVMAHDTANYFGAAPALTEVKQVNGLHESAPPGLHVQAGQTVTFTYVVTNSGNVRLDPVTVIDNVLGAIACPQTALDPGQSETCSKTATVGVGQQVNKATATGQAVDPSGNPVGSAIAASDTAYYVGDTTPTTSSLAPTGPPLAPTGLYGPVVAAAGMILVLAGFILLALSRRRRTSRRT